MLLDYHIHISGHGEQKYSIELLKRFLQAAREHDLEEIGLVEHDQFAHLADFQLIQLAQRNFPDIKVKTGIEMDYFRGREEEIKKIIAGKYYDFLIGSVHYIDGWAFDHPDCREGFSSIDIDKTYAQYYEVVKDMVSSRLFDIVAHLDLIKIWGSRPRLNDGLYYAKPVLNEIKKSGMAVEINSAGLRKPVGEIYPARDILETMFSINIPITFSSDAHCPEHTGQGIDLAARLAYQAGYRRVLTFKQRKKIMLPLPKY